MHRLKLYESESTPNTTKKPVMSEVRVCVCVGGGYVPEPNETGPNRGGGGRRGETGERASWWTWSKGTKRKW